MSNLQVSPGTILWLPPKPEVRKGDPDGTNNIDKGFFHHPVLIVAVDSTKTKIMVLGVSTYLLDSGHMPSSTQFPLSY